MMRCAYLFVNGNWVGYHNPTIGELRSLREKGAVVMHKHVARYGNEIHTTWVATDSGLPVTERIDFL